MIDCLVTRMFLSGFHCHFMPLVGTGALSSVAWSTRAQLMIFHLLQISSGIVLQSRDTQLSHNTLYLLRPRLSYFKVLDSDLFVYLDDSLTDKRVIMRTKQPTYFLYNFRY